MFKEIVSDKIALNVSETAELIGVSQTTIYTMVKKNEIPHKRVRNRIIFSKEVISSWLRGDTYLPADQPRISGTLEI